MKYKLDKFNQLHIIDQDGNEKVISAEITEQLSMVLLPIAKKYLDERGITNNL